MEIRGNVWVRGTAMESQSLGQGKIQCSSAEKHKNEVDIQNEGMQAKEKMSQSNSFVFGYTLSFVLDVCKTTYCTLKNKSLFN